MDFAILFSKIILSSTSRYPSGQKHASVDAILGMKTCATKELWDQHLWGCRTPQSLQKLFFIAKEEICFQKKKNGDKWPRKKSFKKKRQKKTLKQSKETSSNQRSSQSRQESSSKQTVWLVHRWAPKTPRRIDPPRPFAVLVLVVGVCWGRWEETGEVCTGLQKGIAKKGDRP